MISKKIQSENKNNFLIENQIQHSRNFSDLLNNEINLMNKKNVFNNKNENQKRKISEIINNNKFFSLNKEIKEYSIKTLKTDSINFIYKNNDFQKDLKTIENNKSFISNIYSPFSNDKIYIKKIYKISTQNENNFKQKDYFNNNNNNSKNNIQTLRLDLNKINLKSQKSF